MCHRCHQPQEPKSSSRSKRAGGVGTLTASTSVSGHNKADAASNCRYRLMGSVSVCSCSGHLLSHSRNQTQHHHHHHLQLTENASGSGRTAGQQQVNGSRAYLAGTWCSLHALLVLTLGGKLCSQQLFTQEAAGIKYRLLKTELWISRKPGLNAALLATPTAKVASSAQFLHHIRHRMQHTAAAQTHFGDRRHRQLRWRSFIKQQQAYTAICKEITGGSKETVVAYGDAKFSSSCCKGNPSTPTVSLRRKLGHCCQVYDTEEYRTSKLCCACKTAMDGMPLPLLGNTCLCCRHWLHKPAQSCMPVSCTGECCSTCMQVSGKLHKTSKNS